MRQNNWGLLCAMLMACVIFTLTSPANAEDKKTLLPADQMAIGKAVKPHLAVVELTLQYDNGEPPEGSFFLYSNYYSRNDGKTLVEDERPMELPAFILGTKLIMTQDLSMHRRFIKSVVVRYKDKIIKAKLAGIAKSQCAAFYALEQPLPDEAVMKFDAKATKPYRAVTYGSNDGQWQLEAKPLPSTITMTVAGKNWIKVIPFCLITDAKGTPVGIASNGVLPVDESWKGSPLQWQQLPITNYDKLIEKIKQITDATLLRATLNFRSPSKSASDPMSYGRDDDAATEVQCVAVVWDADTVLLLAKLKPSRTKRLERIQVYDASGKAHQAKFTGSLKDYGALVAKLDQPLSQSVSISHTDVTSLKYQLLAKAHVTTAGQQRIAYQWHERLIGYEKGYRRKLYPQVRSYDNEGSFLFTPDGQLLILPIAKREKVSVVEERWDDNALELTPAAWLSQVMKALPEHSDPNNVPLSEEEENRLAWLGVSLQPLGSELARANEVADQTRDGEFGALVTYVYPGSPAAKVGLEPGAILLKLYVVDQPKPIEVQVERSVYADRPFPWDKLDQLPEQYFDQIPPPWPSAENSFTRALTDLGFGKKYEAEMVIDGKTIKKKFTVIQSPPHYKMATKYKSKTLGLTVRNLTYEVRRQLQKKSTDPGVIVSKIEPGSKVSVAGLKPFEVITAVNGKKINNVKEFEKQLAAVTDEVRLSINRMSRNRQITIKLSVKPKADDKSADEAKAETKAD